jgi:hypothetical protein
MLQIKLNANKYEITDKKTTAVLEGSNIVVQQQTIVSPGEYDAEGVEVVYGERAALLVWERLQAVYVFSTESPKSFDKSQFASADVVIIGTEVTQLNKDSISELLEAYDPTVIIASSNTTIDESLAAAMKVQQVPLVKLSEQTLPVEGRDFYQIG